MNTPKMERGKKRRTIAVWRESRLRRLEYRQQMNRATPRQLDRIHQLNLRVSADAQQTP